MAIFADNFTGSDGTQLQSHTPDTGTSWTRLWGSNGTLDLVITSNRCVQEAVTNNGVIYTADATYPSADYDITFTVFTLVDLDRPAYVFVRLQDQENMYAARIYRSSRGAISRLYKKVSGTWTALGSLFTGPADGSVCKLEIVGTALKFYDDGVEVASATDSDISAAGKAGLGAGGGAELVATGDDTHATNIIDTLSVNQVVSGTQYNQSVSGGISPSGAIFRSSNKILAGGNTPSGSLNKLTSKTFTGNLSSIVGATSKLSSKAFSGALALSGTLITSLVFSKIIDGAIGFVGTL
jgi:hypothetical protein